MPRSGTLVICVQNLDYSGANQVVLNIVSGRLHESNVIVLSPKIGAFAARFVDSGAAVRIGDLTNLLIEIRDVFCIICNTIMTAGIVVEISKRPQPIVWILHEWWDDDMIKENLSIRSINSVTVDTVKSALKKASMVVFVCEAQRKLYMPSAPSTVIYVGVPSPLIEGGSSPEETKDSSPQPTFVFLSLGIICPRKNQLWAVQLFKKFAGSRSDLKLLIVGARHTRQYEIDYLADLKRLIGDDPRIEVHDVTSSVDCYYQRANCLLFTSINEVTPMVISEAMSWGIPVLTTNIAGIPEMISHGVQGFLFAPNDDITALQYMHDIVENEELRKLMGEAGKQRFAERFEIDIMVEQYRQLLLFVAPPVILVDMDGALVDWDRGFIEKWMNRCDLDRTKSYFMEQCVHPQYQQAAESLILSEGFFEDLSPMEGGIGALNDMLTEGFRVFICTSPIINSKYCAQEKLNWVKKHMGSAWLEKVILCYDKSSIRGDILIDDKPYDFLLPEGKHTAATWKQVLFDAPYNRQILIPRLYEWCDWKDTVLPLLGISQKIDQYIREFGEPVGEIVQRISPHEKRDELRVKAHLIAQHMQDMYLGSIYSEVLSPEDLASITGTGSMFTEDPDLQSGTYSNAGQCVDLDKNTYEEKSGVFDDMPKRNQGNHRNNAGGKIENSIATSKPSGTLQQLRKTDNSIFLKLPDVDLFGVSMSDSGLENKQAGFPDKRQIYLEAEHSFDSSNLKIESEKKQPTYDHTWAGDSGTEDIRNLYRKWRTRSLFKSTASSKSVTSNSNEVPREIMVHFGTKEGK